MRKLGLLFVCLCAFVRAQDPTGALEGQVTDASSARISKADVKVENSQTGYATTSHTSPEGEFHFSNLPVGEYSLRVTAPGFTPFVASSVRINIGRIVN